MHLPRHGDSITVCVVMKFWQVQSLRERIAVYERYIMYRLTTTACWRGPVDAGAGGDHGTDHNNN